MRLPRHHSMHLLFVLSFSLLGPLLSCSVDASAKTSASTPIADSTDSWLTYRGNAARTGAVTTPGPKATPAEQWVFSTGNSIYDAALVSGGNVLAAQGVASLLALDLETGDQAFHIETGIGPGGTTISADGIAYVKDQTAGLSAFDIASSEKIWTVDLVAANDPGPVVDGVIYSGGMDDKLHALNAHTGEELWSIDVPGGVVVPAHTQRQMSAESQFMLGNRPAAVDSGILTMPAEDGTVAAFDLTHHEYLWSASCGSGAFVDTPAMADGTVYVACFGGSENEVLALAITTGAEQWRFAAPAHTSFRTPAIGAEALFVSGNDGLLRAIDRSSGSQIWSFQAEPVFQPAPPEQPGIFYYDAAFIAPPILADGVVYVDSAGGMIYAIDATTGQELWNTLNYDLDIENDFFKMIIGMEPDNSHGGLIMVDGTLLLTTNGGRIVAFR